MLWVESLRWTSRAEVCDRLALFLFETSSIPVRQRDYTRPASVPARSDVARLLAPIADSANIPSLRRLVTNTGEKQFIRIEALQALARLRAEVPLPELRRWLDDRSLWEASLNYGYLTDLISLFRSDEARPFIMRFLADWPPMERARLLRDCLMARRAEISTEIVAFLYDTWSGPEHELLEGVTVPCYDPRLLNFEIAVLSPDRPHSRSLLIARWRKAEGDQRRGILSVLWQALGEFPASTAQSSAELSELANALVLTRAALIEYFGTSGLLSLLEHKIRTASRIVLPEINGQTARQSRVELPRACSLVRYWPDDSIEDRMVSWIGCPDLSPYLRGELLRFLWERNPDRGAGVLRRARNAAEFLPVLRRFLVKAAHRLRGSERDFLEWATGQDADPVVRYYAVQSLESLGEDSLAWQRRLERFARSEDPYLRLHAAAALSRRGETSRWEEVVDAASTADHVCVRAEALRILCEADASRHRALLHRAMMAEPARCDHGSPGGTGRYSKRPGGG